MPTQPSIRHRKAPEVVPGGVRVDIIVSLLTTDDAGAVKSKRAGVPEEERVLFAGARVLAGASLANAEALARSMAKDIVDSFAAPSTVQLGDTPTGVYLDPTATTRKTIAIP